MIGKMSKWTVCLVVTGIGLAFSATAYANSFGTVEVELYGAPGWGADAPGGYAPMAGHMSQQVCTGVYRLAVNTTAGSYTGVGGTAIVNYAKSNNGLIDSFCADIWQAAPASFRPYTIVDLNDNSVIIFGNINQTQRDEKVADLYKLFSNFMPGGPHNTYNPSDPDFNKGWTNDTAAAFQACVWEIINESPANPYNVSFNKGTFYENWSAGWIGTANGWLTTLGGLPTVDQQSMSLFVLANPESQDYAAVGVVFVPEPLTMLGLIAGVGGVGAYLRKRRAA